MEKAIKELETRRKSRVFALVSPNSLVEGLVSDICAQWTVDKLQTLDILLDSVGGDIDVTYQLLNFLRDHTSKLRVVVPDYAKSAATFLCLGADEICLTRTAELGPLDAQIPDPRKSGAFMSALDAFKALEYLRQYAMETLDLAVKMILQRSSLTVREALEEARQFVSIVITPLYQQVRPLDLGEYRRILAVGEEYGRRVMGRYSYAGRQSDDIESIINRIVWSYPSHGFVIDYEEAKELGLNVSLLSKEDSKAAKYIGESVDELVGFVSPAEEQEPCSKPKKREG
ncbi:MAG: hypothetical protein HXY36_06750 [Chloroflexi bacterium]|nr:hypothetical protein [Chloroflexota bacterium]